ncbi:hypothetical protein Rhe02_71860 [Rhizocola hellebori]|uniref:DUF2231 domain-containing protein n=1 Tax=Rhizocola hellebori TaxID=1392758 RepID=A0A8J3QE36_9ACTN|nr:DUF2231 domain-containing protein [Rhizocola hellebori]GIH09119.1 hypothetical protein Rhe02_71860 [Rhizocola hellebori]
MIDELFGLPAHPLIVHAAVVFGPLLVASALAYAFVPMLRKYLGWVVVSLAFVAPIALWFARLSGEALRDRQIANGAQGQALKEIDVHQGFGELAAWWGTGLGLAALALVYYCTTAGRRPTVPSSRAISYALIAVTAVLAVLTGYYVFRTGDSGARMVWS